MDSGMGFSLAAAPSPSIDLSAYNFPLNDKHKAQFAEVELVNEDKSKTSAIRISIAADLKDKGDGRETIVRLAKELKDYDLKIEPVISQKDGKPKDIGHNYARNEDDTPYNAEAPIERKDSNGNNTTAPFYVEAYEVTVSGDPEVLKALKAGLEQASVKKFANTIKEKRNNLQVSR